MHLRADGSVDPEFRAHVQGTVQALALDREKGVLWVGGDFWRVLGEWRESLVALDAATGAARPWLSGGIADEVNDIELHGERVYVGRSSGASAIDRRTGERIDWSARLGPDRSTRSPSATASST